MTEMVNLESQVKTDDLFFIAAMMHLFYSIYPLWIVHRMARERKSPQFLTLSTRSDFWGGNLKYYSLICYGYTSFIGHFIFASSELESKTFPKHDFILVSMLEYSFDCLPKLLPIMLQIIALTAVVVPVLFVVANAFKKPLLTMAAIAVHWQLIAFVIARKAWNGNETKYSHQEMLTFVTSYLVLFLTVVVIWIITFVLADILWHSRFGKNLFTRFRLVYGFQRYFFVQFCLKPN